MKHLLPRIEQLVKTDFVVLHSASNDHETSEAGSYSANMKFVKSGQNYYYIPHANEHDDAVRLPRWKVEAVSSDEPLSSIAAAFANGPMLLVEAGNEPIGYVTSIDFTQAVIQSYRYLNAYFETTLDMMDNDTAVTLINDESQVAVWTSGAEHIFSIPKEDIVGKPASDFFPVDRLQSLRTLRTGESVYRQQHQPRPDLFVLINAKPVMLDGGIIGAVAAEIDITTQIRLHQELLHMSTKVHHLQREVAMLNPSSDPFRKIQGTSGAIKRCIEAIKKISASKATVLIQGESGTGKELVAKAIHDSREQSGAPFIAINCGAIPPSLFESELFGYERGAFSGADPKGKKGKIELAGGGTLFLDEIGEMPLDMQVKLLRVLQEKTYFPVGGTQLKTADCRIVAATNRDLKGMIAEAKFREDMYYRLNVVSIDIPPLRDRKEDIYELAQSFLHEFSLLYDRPIVGFPREIVQDLLQYEWPGNIRELRNAIERLVIFAADGNVLREYLPSSIYSGSKRPPVPAAGIKEPEPLSFQEKLDAYEKELLLQSLELENGNKLAIAKRLGMSRATLYNRMKRLGL